MRRHLAITSTLLAAATLGAQTCVDQSYLPNPTNNGLEITANQNVTQTFTAGMTGLLTHVEISELRHHQGLAPNPLTVEIVAVDATGTPTLTVLASVVFAPSAIATTSGPLLVDVSAAGIQVAPGLQLGIKLTSPNTQSQPSYAWSGTAPGGAYAGGQIFIRDTIALSVWDLSFRTFVHTPATFQNYGTGHPGTSGIPTLTMSAAPILGTNPNIQIGASAPLVLGGFLVFGFQRDNAPTAFGGTALVQPLTARFLTIAQNGAFLPFPVPFDASLCAVTVNLQSIAFDPGASAGIAFSPGLELIIGT